MPNIKWLGHAFFQITSAGNKTILIDPWIENPCCTVNLENLSPPDVVLITHDHYDHIGNAVDVIKKGVRAVVQPEIAEMLINAGISPDSLVRMNIGGTINIDEIKITMVQAFHSSNRATPVGFILTLEDNTVIYHAGDTGVFSDMKLLGEMYKVDIALLPIGGVFTMDARQAVVAAQLIKPKKIIPMHFRSFPVLAQNADDFVSLAKQETPDIEVIVLEPGESLIL